MTTIHLVTGGSRSGKSEYARRIGEEAGGPKVYVASCPVTDDEMAARIEEHRARREGRGWDTIEEQTDLAGVLQEAEHRTVMIDCLTLWINNLMRQADQRDEQITEDTIARRSRRLLDACRQREGLVILVTNEVGMGVVPGNRAARQFRDLVGRCNQVIAAGADRVTLMTCGIPVHVRGDTNDGPS